MTIGINASFLRKKDTGIGQVTLNFIQKLIELSVEDISFILYVEEDSGLELPKNFEERVFLPSLYKRDDLVRKIIWEKRLLPKEARRDECDIFLSLYQSATVFKKGKKEMDSHRSLSSVMTGGGNDKGKGLIRHIMLVHDAVWKIFPEYLDNWRKKKYYKLVDEGIMKADKILTVSENSRKDIVKHLGITEGGIDVRYVDCDERFRNQNGEDGQNENNGPVCKTAPAEEDANLDPRSAGGDDMYRGNENKKISDQVSTSSSDRRDDNYIFYVGGFDIRKNVDGLIEAYGMLWKKWEDDQRESSQSKIENQPLPNPLSASSADKLPKQKEAKSFPSLVLAGSFHSHLVPLVTDLPNKIKEVCKKYDLPKEKIRRIGFVEQKDLPSWYKNAKLFCYPTLYEGFGLPVLEAQNCGCPVVTSNVSSIPEIVNIDNAILVNPESPEEIAGAMYNCLTSEGLRNKLVSEGKKNVIRFSWDKFTKDVLMDMLKMGSSEY